MFSYYSLQPTHHPPIVYLAFKNLLNAPCYFHPHGPSLVLGTISLEPSPIFLTDIPHPLSFFQFTFDLGSINSFLWHTDHFIICLLPASPYLSFICLFGHFISSNLTCALLCHISDVCLLVTSIPRISAWASLPWRKLSLFIVQIIYPCSVCTIHPVFNVLIWLVIVDLFIWLLN